jgi:hypothetical protein
MPETVTDQPVGVGEGDINDEKTLAGIAEVLDKEDQPGEGEPPEDGPERPDEGTDGEPEEEGEEDTKQPTFTVKIDGKNVRVTRDELLAGYQRNADYTQKTQQLAEYRRELEQHLAAASAERAQYAQMLGLLQQQLAQNSPDQALEAIRRTDPAEYAARRLDLERQRAWLAQEQMRMAAIQQAEHERSYTAHINEEAQKLLNAVPEWKDAQRRKQELDALREFAESRGYSADEINNVTDHRAILILREAYKLDQARKKAKQQPPPQVRGTAAPGTAQPQGASGSKRAEEARQRLAKTGSIDDAAAYIENIL